jgi:hypothetical protein
MHSLSKEIGEAEANSKYPDGEKLSSIINMVINSALNDAICDAVDMLDGITPDCNREFILFSLRGREETGPPDPFTSKSRFRNDLIQALIWWALPKNEFQQKKAGQVSMSDLTYFFSLCGYFDEAKGSPVNRNSEYSQEHGLGGGDERTIRRWMRKYVKSSPSWPKLRSSLIETIKRTGYPLV